MTTNPTEANSRRAELEAFLAAHPGLTHVDGVLADLCGTVRGKRYPRGEVSKLFENGFYLPFSTAFLDVTGACSDPLGRGFSDGDPDGLALPMPGTLKPVPWSDRESAQVLMTMYEADGRPARSEPRNVAARVIERFSALGLKARVAFELEFYLLDPELGPDGQPQCVSLPLDGSDRRAIGPDDVQVYGVAELERMGGLLDEIYRAGELQDIPLSVATSEYGPGQFEINLNYSDDALQAADHCALLRHLVKSVAERHGVRASFAGKPFADQAGSGMHLHISALDAQGENVFAHDSPHGSERLGHAIGGAAATVFDAMAIYAANANAYRRFAPNLYVPVNRRWTVNNRSGALRVPSGPAHARRLEHRVASADANPYLVLAATLAGVHHGLERSIDPGEPAPGNICGEVDPDMPLDWSVALDRLEGSSLMREYLSDDYIDLYCATKRAERARLYDRPSRREMQWYL